MSFAGTRLQAFVDAVEANLNDSTVEFRTGDPGLEKGRHGKRRRVHFYRAGGRIDTTRQAGGRLEGDTDEATGSREPAVWQRLEDVVCGIFAESPATADALLDNMIVAIDHASPNGGLEFNGYEWQETQIAQRVPMVTLSLALKLPVVDEQKTLVEITAEELSCELEV